MKATEYYQIGLQKAEEGDYLGAIKCFDNAIELDKSIAEYYIRRAHTKVCTVDVAQILDAYGDYSLAMKMEPNNAEAIAGVGSLKMQLNPDDPEGLEYLERAMSIDARKVSYWTIGIAKLNIGDYKGMYTAFSNFIFLEHPQNEQLGEAYYFRGLAAAYLNEYVESIINFTLAIKNNATHNYVSAFFNRAISYTNVNSSQKAIDDYTKVLSIEPNNCDALLNRGELFLKIENFPEALNDIRRLILINGKYFQILDKLIQKFTTEEKFKELSQCYSLMSELKS